ncbi:multidrug efflux SMR transporter [Halobacillus sp. Marseille-Q1614]|uniref:DMT family transporter n=1 Tax=Halobacillus sp. Marseille-Q1614 TaxID=2709134 RepID=UPI00156EFF77|nr:multidrug efflux SMR transporter [Halobacillus sp. Marseille-Q1614]
MNRFMILAIAITAEVFATAMLKVSDGFSVLLPSIGVVAGYLFSFYLLSLALRIIPLSLAYAIWSGAGAALSVMIGIFFWGEAMDLLKFSGIALIVAGIVLLNSSKAPVTEEKRAVSNN